jgi:Zincin-like metallopeptidase
MGWYIVIKTIKGHPYRYRQRTWREGNRARTESVYLGPAENGGGRGDDKGREEIPKRDVAGERALIDKIFDTATLIGSVQFPGSPWAGRYSSRPRFTPDMRLMDLPRAMGAAAISRPWAGRRGQRQLLQDGALYAPRRDLVQLPDHSRFVSPVQFTRVVLHELAHATGHERRLNRSEADWSFEGYAREEMVADLTAHLVAYRLGWPGVEVGEAARYVQGYLKRCENAEDARAYAEREAQRASDYLVNLVTRMRSG